MKIVKCDIEGCEENAFEEDVMACRGFIKSNGLIEYEPFERSTVRGMDLCEKHYREWCRATYEVFWGKVE